MKRLFLGAVMFLSAFGAASPPGASASDAGVAADAGPHSYLLLSGVALEEVILAVRRMNPDYRTLYDRVVESEFVELSPHLFPYDPQSRFAQVWLAMGHGNAYGMRLVSRASSLELVKHLQQYLLADVTDGSGTTTQLYLLLFDPRALHTFLRTLHPEQLKAFFGPVDAWIVESEDDPTLDAVYRLDAAGALHSGTVASPASTLSQQEAEAELARVQKPGDAEATRKHLEHFGQLQSFASARQSATPLANVCPCNAFKLSRPSGVTLDQGQYALFSEQALRWYKHRVFVSLAKDVARDLPPAKLRQLIEVGYLQAKDYGIGTESTVRDYLELCVRRGLGFHLEPRAQKILKNQRLEAAAKLKQLRALFAK